MRAVQFSAYGGPDVLQMVTLEEPHPGPGQIRIQVRAASVNPIDWKIRGGMLGGDPEQLPIVLGSDAAGVVEAVGEGVEDVSVGDEVLGLGSAAHAESALLRVWVPRPASLDWDVAAALPVAAETTVRVLDLLGVGSGDTVLVDGGAGGVGTIAVQTAVARGARVLATGGEGSQDYLASLGATPVRYGEGLADRVRDAAPEGLQAVFDVVGKTPMTELVSLVSDPAQVVSIANFGAATFGARVTTGGESGDPRVGMAEVVDLAAGGSFTLPLRTFTLEEAAEAHRLSEAGHVRGKLVLVP